MYPATIAILAALALLASTMPSSLTTAGELKAKQKTQEVPGHRPRPFLLHDRLTLQKPDKLKASSTKRAHEKKLDVESYQWGVSRD
jgi:hypothetical protein